ncbi:9737_t:CDS:1, partial [Ambispora gerdemannii]
NLLNRSTKQIKVSTVEDVIFREEIDTVVKEQAMIREEIEIITEKDIEVTNIE